MKIQTLLQESQFAKPIYAYHATLSGNMKSILKHGLIPNHTDDGYGSDETSHMGYSLAPQSGVYFTRTGKDALFIASSIEREKNQPIIVVCKIQEKQADLDEDRLSGDVINELKLKHAIRDFLKTVDDVQNIPSADEERFVNSYTEFVVGRIGKNDQYSAYIRPHIKAYIQAVFDFDLETRISGNFDDSDVKRQQGVLTKKLKNSKQTDFGTQDTFKLDSPITYRGANKIVGFYCPNTSLGYGDIGDLDGYAYHITNSPEKILTSSR